MSRWKEVVLWFGFLSSLLWLIVLSFFGVFFVMEKLKSNEPIDVRPHIGKTILIHYNSTGTIEEVTIKAVSPSGNYFNDGYL